MKHLLGTIVIVGLAFITLPGCGGSKETSNVAEGASADKMAEYEAAVKASEDAMTPPSE